LEAKAKGEWLEVVKEASTHGPRDPKDERKEFAE
jgi:hypothetical protein